MGLEIVRYLKSIFKYSCCKNGFRRYAWIFLEDIETAYNPQKAHYEVSFYLPKGLCY